MNRWKITFVLCSAFAICVGKAPFKPTIGAVKFVVYYESWHRGLCVGSLVSRSAVITAAVCVTNPTSPEPDTRPINVVTGTEYRHPKRGVRVPVTKVLIPWLSNYTYYRTYLLQKCPAVLILKRKVPDSLVEIPLRPIDLDYLGEVNLQLLEECIMPGWHFFYKGDTIYPANKFLLQKHLRVQYINIVKKHIWCDALSIKFRQSLDDMGYRNPHDKRVNVCVRDPDRHAQACHGMYGAPLVCRGKIVGLMMAPAAQWTNCTGLSNIIHLFSSNFLRPFMSCVSRLFDPDGSFNMDKLKKIMYDSGETYDFIPEMYDKLLDTDHSSD